MLPHKTTCSIIFNALSFLTGNLSALVSRPYQMWQLKHYTLTVVLVGAFLPAVSQTY